MPGVQTGHLGHQLIGRDRIARRAILLIDLRAGQPDPLTSVVRAEAVRMMQPADRGDVLAVLFERLQRFGQLVTPIYFT